MFNDVRRKQGRCNAWVMTCAVCDSGASVSCARPLGCSESAPLVLIAHIPAQEKNVSADMLEGKVGRIYMPKQDVAGMALHKMKARLWTIFLYRRFLLPVIYGIAPH